MTSISDLQPQFTLKMPEDDNRDRRICDHCGFIDYENPKIVCGVVARWEDKLLLGKRAIHPRKGFWTLPAGFMEQQETTEQGAAREAWEETRADLEIEALLAVYNIPRISQVQIFYTARLTSPSIACGEESSEVGLFGWDDIPWSELAFPSVYWALTQYRTIEAQPSFVPFTNPDGDPTGPLRL